MATQPTLRRVLGPVDAAALIASNVIGVGIFTTPGIVAAMAPDPLAILGAWSLGAALSLAGAVTYAELSARLPYAGGEYVYIRAAFGPLTGFLSGWTSFVAGFSGAIAAGAVGLAAYLGRLIPGVDEARPLFTLPVPFLHFEISRRNLVALAMIYVLSGIHICGLGVGRIVQNILTAAKVSALILLVLLGFSFGNGSISRLTESGNEIKTGSWLLAMIPVMFSYSGWNAAAYVAEEVRDPVRNVPRALLIGTLGVAALYLLLNLLYLYALGLGQLSGSVNAGTVAADSMFGPRAADLLAALIPIMLAGGISAMVIAGPRVYFAMARDGVFLPVAARVNPKYRTPAVAIAAQAVWSTLLVLTGTFEQLLIYTGFAVVLFSGLAALSLFVLDGGATSGRPRFRMMSSRLAGAMFVVASAILTANVVRERPGAAVAGLSVMAAGIPIYYWTKARHDQAAQSPHVPGG